MWWLPLVIAGATFLIDHALTEFDAFGEGAALEAQAQNATDQQALVNQGFDSQESQLEREREATEASFAEQSELFESGAQSFQSSQAQALSIAGVALGAGSAGQAQRKTQSNINADRTALNRNQAVGLSQFDVAAEGLNTQRQQSDNQYQNYLLGLEQAERARHEAPFRTLLGSGTQAVGQAFSTYFDTQSGPSPGTNTGTGQFANDEFQQTYDLFNNFNGPLTPANITGRKKTSVNSSVRLPTVRKGTTGYNYPGSGLF